MNRALRLAALAELPDVLAMHILSAPRAVESAILSGPSNSRRLAAPALCRGLSAVAARHIGCSGAVVPVASLARDLNLPFNRTGSKTVSIGGKTLGLSFTASYLVGTNLNCKNANFAYELTADVQASLNLFGQTQQAFDANFVYGQNGGTPLADAATLTAFEKPVWSQNLPVESYCKSETLPIGDVKKGVSVSHTVWVSIVPVEFTASADLDLGLSWDWSLCTNDLSASVGIAPSAALQLSGSTVVDLLVLRAGITLQGSLAAAVEPQAFVHGTACGAGVDATLNKPGDSGLLTGYSQFRKCKWIFFDCHWEEQKVHQFWSHQGAPSQSTIFNKTFTISL